MSGFKPPELSEFYRHIRSRALTAGILAEFAGCTRPALTRVLNGARRRGPIWDKIAPVLTEEERRLLDVAHSSTWNTARVAKRPRWLGLQINLSP